MMRLSEDTIAGHIQFLQRCRVPLAVVIFVTTIMLMIPSVMAKFASTEVVVMGPSEVVDETADEDNVTSADVTIEAIEKELLQSSSSDSSPETTLTPSEIEQSLVTLRSDSPLLNSLSLDLGKQLGRNLPRDFPAQKQAVTSLKNLAVWAATRKLEQDQNQETPNLDLNPEPNSETNSVLNSEPERLVLVNPSKNNASISFLLDGKVTTLKSGAETTLDSDIEHSIQFHRGGKFGVGKHSLESGRFEFRVSSKGWRLDATENE